MAGKTDNAALASLESKIRAGVRLLSFSETALILGIPEKTLRNKVGPKAPNRLPIKSKKLGRRRLFDVQAVHAFIDSLPDAE